MNSRTKKLLKRIGLAALCLLLALLLIVGAYLAYVLIAYYRIGDRETEIKAGGNGQMRVMTEYSFITWNIGFAAYSRDFSFFMDGGTESRAYSEEEVYKNLDAILARLQAENADFMFLQEVDTDATRSYHVNEKDYITAKFSSYSSSFAENYDSPYLFYPFSSPHGKSKAGLLTLSKAEMSTAHRVEVPVEDGFMKFLDLDRCYHKIALPTENGKTLYIYNLHLSAYTSDGTIATEQLRLLLADMEAEYQNGNYVIAGGDFNKDLLGENTAICGDSENTWAQPFPTALLGEHFSLVAGDGSVHSCRNCDTGYQKGTTFEVTVDGFIVSQNVTVSACKTIDEDFQSSDHNPVKITFSLQPEEATPW